MKILFFGTSGMVGQGALRECLLDPTVTEVISIGRTPLEQTNAKLRDIIQNDITELEPLKDLLKPCDGCLFCLGVSSSGMSEENYRKLTYDLTLKIASQLAEWNPGMTFLYVSGAGTDSTEKGSSMWARVKGETENALLRLPFQAAYMLRPGTIQPLHGIRSKTRLYRVAYILGAPILPLLQRLFPKQITTTEKLGRVMIRLVRNGAPKPILETGDIADLSA